MTSHTHRIRGFDVTAHHHGLSHDGAPLVVFVHGMMEPGDVWGSALRSLARHYRCVVLDLPWNGQQGGLWGMEMGPEQWLRLALDSFDLTPDAWVAHSFGASTLIALMAADQTDRAGLRAPAVLVSPFYKATHHQVTWPLFQAYVNNFTDFVELSIRVRMNHRDIDPEILRRMTETARDAFGCYVWVQFWQLFARMPFLPVDRLTQPILTLTGAQDSSSPLDDVRALHTALPHSRLEVYPQCEHFLLKSRPRETSAAIHQFLATVCPVEAESFA